MNDPQQPKAAGLAGLSIDRRQRPGTSGRARILLGSIFVTIAAIAIAASWWYYNTTGRNIVASMTTPPKQVTLLLVAASEDESQAPVLVANGQIVSDLQIKVATKVSGQIVELNVEQGDQVQQGQVLARVEDTVYRAQRNEASALVARRRHEIARARAEHTRAQAAIKRLQADLEYEERNHRRLQQLHQRGQVDDLELDNAKNAWQAATAAVEEARAAEQSAAAVVDIAQAELEAAEAVLERTQKRLDDCAIVAPISGVVLERNAQVGDFLAAEGGRGANANAQLVEIADMQRLRVEIDVSERDVHRLRPDQQARITPDVDRGRTYDGQILWIDPVGDYARAIVQVKVRILDPGPDLRVGGSAKVEFLSPVRPAVVTDRPAGHWLPKDAVQMAPGSAVATVFTVVDGRATANPVTIGTRSDKTVEILDGLKPDMQIIADEVDDLTEGMRVKVVGVLRADSR